MRKSIYSLVCNRINFYHSRGNSSSIGIRKTEDITYHGGTIHILSYDTVSGSRKYSSSRHKLTVWSLFIPRYWIDTLLLPTSHRQVMRNSSHTIRDSDTTLAHAIYSRLLRSYMKNISEYSHVKKNHLWHSQGYDDIHPLRSSPSPMENPISLGILIWRRFLHDTITEEKI